MITRSIFALFAIIFSAELIAQDNEPKPEVEAQDHFIFNIGYENFVFSKRPDGLKHKLYNNGFGFQLMYDKPLGRGNVSVAIGLGISRQNYHSNAVIRSGEAQLPDGTEIGEPEGGVNYFITDGDVYESSRLSTTFAEVPAELRIRTNPNEKGYSWKFTAGITVGYLTGIHDKQIVNDDKYKWFIFPDVTTVSYGPHVRIAYGKIGITARYRLNTFYEENRGPEMNQLSVGLTIMPF